MLNALKATFIVSMSVTALFIAGCSGDSREADYLRVENSEYQRQIKELEDRLYQADSQQVNKSLAGKPNTLDNLQTAVGPQTTVSTQDVSVVFSVPGEVLFASGSSALTAEAKSSLNKVISVINERFPGHNIRIAGHTDDQPIQRAKGRWEDNWDLSTGRARSVLLYLEGRGVQKSRMSLMGFADQNPQVANSSDSNRKLNRRVEIIAVPPKAER